jgi:tetratricopeptide (TPR) repeat protein
MFIRAFLAFVGAFSLALSPAHARWVEASSNHFIVYGDMSEAQARSFANDLEKYDRALRFFTRLPETDGSSANRLTVYVVPDVAAVRRLINAPNSGIAGFYRPHAAGSMAFTPRSMPAGSTLNPRQILLHEYAHHILLSSAANFYPGWVSEGLAEFFMTSRIDDDGGMVIGAPNIGRARTILSDYRLPLRRLLASDSVRLSPEEIEGVYSRGWLLIHFLLLSGDRGDQFSRYLAAVANGASSVEAGERVFGNLGQLDIQLDNYRQRTRIATVRMTPEQLPTGTVTVRELRPGEAAMMPVRMRSVVGVSTETAPLLVPEARRVAIAHPNDAWVHRALAEVEYDAGNLVEAEAAADRAIALDHNMASALAYKGMIRARRAAADPGVGADAWRDARSWYIRANRVDPDYALPLVLYFDSFVQAGQTPTANAANGLLRAVQLVPQDEGLRLRVGRELLRQGDLPSARRAIAPVAFSPHARGENVALLIVQQIDAGADAAAVLAAADAAKWNRIGSFDEPEEEEGRD